MSSQIGQLTGIYLPDMTELTASALVRSEGTLRRKTTYWLPPHVHCPWHTRLKLTLVNLPEGATHFNEIVGSLLDVFDAVAKLVEAMQVGNQAECDSLKRTITMPAQEMIEKYEALMQKPCVEEGSTDVD
eukprot:3665891-Prymnesium_polylepis.2